MGNKQNIEKLAAGHFACSGSKVPSYQLVCSHFSTAKYAGDIDEDCSFDQFMSIFLKAHNYIVNNQNK